MTFRSVPGISVTIQILLVNDPDSLSEFVRVSGLPDPIAVHRVLVIDPADQCRCNCLRNIATHTTLLRTEISVTRFHVGLPLADRETLNRLIA